MELRKREAFRGKDEATLKDMLFCQLDSCVNFEERKKIRDALRDVQGLNRGACGGIKPLSFRPRNLKLEPSKSTKIYKENSGKSFHLSLKEDENKADSFHCQIVEQSEEINSDENVTKGCSLPLQDDNKISINLKLQEAKFFETKGSTSSRPEDKVRSVLSSDFTVAKDTEIPEFSHEEILKSSSPQDKSNYLIFPETSNLKEEPLIDRISSVKTLVVSNLKGTLIDENSSVKTLVVDDLKEEPLIDENSSVKTLIVDNLKEEPLIDRIIVDDLKEEPLIDENSSVKTLIVDNLKEEPLIDRISSVKTLVVSNLKEEPIIDENSSVKTLVLSNSNEEQLIDKIRSVKTLVLSNSNDEPLIDKNCSVKTLVVSNLNEEPLSDRKQVCRFLSRGKITSNIPKSAIKSEKETATHQANMEGPVKNYKSQLIIGSIGNSKAANLPYQSHVFTSDNSENIDQSRKNMTSGGHDVRRSNSLKVLKKNQLNQEKMPNEGGTVITEEIRRKSLGQSLINNGNILSNNKESGAIVTGEMRRKSLEQSSLRNDDILSKSKESGAIITEEMRRKSLEQSSLSNYDISLKSKESGAVITEEMRRKSLEQSSLSNYEILSKSKESGAIITKEMRRRSMDQCSLETENDKNSHGTNEINGNFISQNSEKTDETDKSECNKNEKDISVKQNGHESFFKTDNEELESEKIHQDSMTTKNTTAEKQQDSNCSVRIETPPCSSLTEDKSSSSSSKAIDIDDTADGCNDCQKNQEANHEGQVQCQTEEEFTKQIQELQIQLKECQDFTKRRKIRGRIRKLREQFEGSDVGKTMGILRAFELRRKPVVYQFVDSCLRINGVKRDLTLDSTAQQDYSQVDSKDELRKLLTQTNDYEEKKQIRLALRQLRQRDREREGGNSRGPTTSLTRSQSVKDFDGCDHQANNTNHPRIGRCTSVIDRPKESGSQIEQRVPLPNGYYNGIQNGRSEKSVHVIHDSGQLGSLNSIGENHISKHSDDIDNNSPPSSPLRRSFSLNSLRRKRSEKDISVTSPNSSNFYSVHSDSPVNSSSSSEFSEHSKHTSRHSKDISDHSEIKNNSVSFSENLKDNHVLNDKDNFKNTDAVRRKSVPASAKHFKDSDKSGSESDSSSCRDWLEKKRRNSLTVIDTKKLNSTMDIEAAFSEILNAVDTEEENNNEDSPELEIMEVDGLEKINIKTPRITNDKISTSAVDINFNYSEAKTVSKPNNDDYVQMKEKEEAIIEEQVTPVIQSPISTELQITPVKKDRPVFTLAPVTPLNDSLSVIEDDDGSITVQSVSYKDQGDCVVTEKTTLRRSQSRTEEEEKDTVIESKVTSPGGSDHFEKDVIKTKRKLTSRGSDYFSRSQYKSKWLRNKEGETIEEHDVTVESDNFPSPKVSPGVIGDNRLLVPGRMDVSKASSGYGSVSGSDEEEKEEAVATALQGQPSGSPEIKATLKDLVTLEGSNAVLETIVTCSPSPDITWYKGDKSVMNNRHYEAKYDNISGRATLTVLGAKKEDTGPYKCTLRNPLGEAETKASLTVRSRAKKKPQFTKPLKNMVATEGHSVCLECSVNDATQIAWYKDGIIQRNTSDFKQTFDGLIAKLDIEEIFVDDHGEYSCVAKNDFGENRTSCKIIVKETACETDVVPMFLTKPESKIHECSDTVTLQCDVIGSPQPTIRWTRDQQTVGIDNCHKQTFDGRTAVLLITKSTIEDSGKYECIAENTSGKVSVDALIVVKAKQATPEILSPLTDETAVCGKSLTLKCDVNGNPSPMIVWRKDNRIIGNTKDFRQTYQDVTAKLQISDIHKEDAGCYECVARNVHGAITTKCSVVVEGSNSGSVGADDKSKTQFDWLVGRDKNTPVIGDKQKEPSIKRSESMKITSNYSLRDKYRKATQPDDAIKETTNETPNKVTVTMETIVQKNDTDNKVDINTNKTKFEDPLKQKAAIARSKGPEDPPWKNVTLRRTESARAPVGRRESPFLRKRKEELAGKLEVGSSPQNNDDPSKLATKPPGWRPVIGDKKDSDTQKETEVLSSLRQVNLRRCDSARSLRDEIKQTGSNISANAQHDGGSRTDNFSADKKTDNETPKLGQTSSTRLLFERKLESDQPKDTQLTNFLNRPGSGLRRTSSLKITQAERDAGTRPVVHSRMNGGLDLEQSKRKVPCCIQGEKSTSNRFSNKEGDQKTRTMPTYDNIDDEDELHKILSKTDDFDERKKIRNRMREIREKKSKEMEVKRLQREKETEDIFKRKFAAAEADQKRQVAAFEKAAKETKEEREKIMNIKDDIIKEHLKESEEAKKRQLAAFDRIASKGSAGTVSSQAGFGGQSFTKTPAQPAGAQGAMNKFKSMEPAGAGGAKPNFMAGGRGGGRGGGTAVRRSPSAIKEMLLNWTKAMTAGYENVEVTNFSSSWNNGMAFCALIHHFYPESFDFARLDPKKRRANFTLAFNIAEKYADIAPLLDVDDMVKMQKPDWKCVFTYVQSFYRKLNDHPRNGTGNKEQ
ncbi:Smoothelin,Smoothelin-like protein 1 [Mytilus coruscus]|uniref:Smoothelin,Smoothelin-like protein 1 n=1 Tax=Mytilus coruscus TaxID=42192 RepID=A0A6J8AF75_MYTCO|nr:Smoothelin,Smoothelin-like protein 1 [Mytilus coruscus]